MKVSNRNMNTRKKPAILASTIVVVILFSAGSFFLGAIVGMNVGLSQCNKDLCLNSNSALRKPAENEGATAALPAVTVEKPFHFPETVKKFATGMVSVPRDQFTSHFELGVPLDRPDKGKEEVLLLYQVDKAHPKALNNQKASSSLLSVPVEEAVENCDHLNMIFSHTGGGRQQCVAIVPQYESYHIQKWMRVPKNGGKLDANEEFRMVSRGYQTNGREQFPAPEKVDTKKHWDMLRDYLASVDEVLDELRPILKDIAKDNTVIVMVCNFGQSELLVNFACSSQARGFDLSHVIVFATDRETQELAESVGLTAYFDERNFGDIPEEAAGRYGDRKFVAMMMAKVVCVQLVSMLGYDLLFQDVDMVWFRDPLEYFHDKKSPMVEFDVYFQDDGAHSLRYAPYSANSGFYYVRHNSKTQYFLTSLLMAGDLILKTDSHQQAMVAVMSEHASLYGLRVKVLSRDEEEFPGGFQYHKKDKKFMKDLFLGNVHPYIFHMSWTHNKDNKLLFFKQMGEWYVQEQCVAKKKSEVTLDNNDYKATCCSAQPLISCHYKDKPSKKPCRDSPPIDKNGKSFW